MAKFLFPGAGLRLGECSRSGLVAALLWLFCPADVRATGGFRRHEQHQPGRHLLSAASLQHDSKPPLSEAGAAAAGVGVDGQQQQRRGDAVAAAGVPLLAEVLARDSAVFLQDDHPLMPRCIAHMRDLVKTLDRQYTDAQLESTLLHFCKTSDQFSSIEDGYRTHGDCVEFAHRLVKARDAELADGNTDGYLDFCQAYYDAKYGRTKPEMSSSKDVERLPRDRKKKVLKEGEGEEGGGGGDKEERTPHRTTSWYVGAALLGALMMAAVLFCVAAALCAW